MTDTRTRMTGEELRQARETLGLTQEALGVRLAVGRPRPVAERTIRAWESGHEPIPYGVPAELWQITQDRIVEIATLADRLAARCVYRG